MNDNTHNPMIVTLRKYIRIFVSFVVLSISVHGESAPTVTFSSTDTIPDGLTADGASIHHGFVYNGATTTSNPDFPAHATNAVYAVRAFVGGYAGTAFTTETIIVTPDDNTDFENLTDGATIAHGRVSVLEDIGAGPTDYNNWVQAFGGDGADAVLAIAPILEGEDTDEGALYVGGRFTGTASLDTGTDTPLEISSSSPDFSDGFIGRLNHRAQGEWVWVDTFGNDDSDDAITGVATDADQNVYAVGAVNGVLVLRKYEPDGPNEDGSNVVEFTTTGTGNVVVSAMSMNDDRTLIYVTGSYEGSVTFGAGTLPDDSPGGDLFIAKWQTSDLSLRWVRVAVSDSTNSGKPLINHGHSLTVDDAGDIYVAGQYRQQMTFLDSLGEPTTELELGDGADDSLNALSAKIDSDGVWRWTATIASGSGDDAVATGIDSDGADLFIGGYFDGTADFGGDIVASAGDTDIFVVRYSVDGDQLPLSAEDDIVDSYVVTAGGAGEDTANAMRVGLVAEELVTAETGLQTAISTTDLFLTGSFAQRVHFDDDSVIAFGDRDALIVKLTVVTIMGQELNEAGTDIIDINRLESTWAWATRAGGFGDDAGYAVAIDSFGLVTVGGAFAATSGFDFSFFTPLGDQDAFVAKLPQTTGEFLNEFWIVGQPIPRPSDAKTFAQVAQAPNIVIIGSNIDDPITAGYFFYSEFNGELFAIQPVTATITWLETDDFGETDGVEIVGSADWPERPRIHVAEVPVAVNNTAEDVQFSGVVYTTNNGQTDSNNLFNTGDIGFSVLQFVDTVNGGTPQDSQSVFTVARTVKWYTETVFDESFFVDLDWEVGTTIRGTDFGHNDIDDTLNGYVFFEYAYYDAHPDNINRAYDRNSRSGAIIPVNEDLSGPMDVDELRVDGSDEDDLTADEDDLVVVWYDVDDRVTDQDDGGWISGTGVGWPEKPVRYKAVWPHKDVIVIASQLGSEIYDQEELLDVNFPDMHIYNQPPVINADGTIAPRPGMNPNEEHADFFPGSATSFAVFALRSDLNDEFFLDDGITNLSEPNVLLKYFDEARAEWAMRVYQVLAEDDVYTFSYSGTAGTIINPPYPITLLPLCGDDNTVDGEDTECPDGDIACKDVNQAVWAKKSGSVTAAYYYPLGEGHYIEDNTAVGECIPWLNFRSAPLADPEEITYHIAWPDEIAVLSVGETLVTSKRGLPDIVTQEAIHIVTEVFDFDNSADATLASLIDPLTPRTVELDAIPSEINTESDGGLLIFADLPFYLRVRLHYDPINGVLGFQGHFDDSAAGEPLLLLNRINTQEEAIIRDLDENRDDSDYQTAITNLVTATGAPNDTEPLLGLPKALTAGNATDSGYLGLMFNNDESLIPLPISMAIIRVECPVYLGEIKVIESDNVFDEKLTLLHSGDFGGAPENFDFQWYYQPDVTGFAPTDTPDDIGNAWIWLSDQSGEGYHAITIQGADIKTISDNWFLVKYKRVWEDHVAQTAFSQVCMDADTDDYSGWAGSPGGTASSPRPQLAEGWIKRAINGLDPFEATVKDFHKTETNTVTSMIIQAGERFEGPVAMSNDPDNLNDIGLIEAYQTILDRGISLSIGGTPPINYGPANNALLFAASRIADFYMLLGNEAFADAADPTIGFDLASKEYGTLAPTIFTFQNQLSSLLQEELALLRGRDETQGTTNALPVYNRLFWNFSDGEGEIAYATSYNISDENDDGVVDEDDARIMFPQGHGDAWGHYLTATKIFYNLLRHENYTWAPRPESVTISGVPVLVDYLDERKFAKAAAAKAKAGGEIMNLTYREHYVADPDGQWQGYKDTEQLDENDSNSRRAWGVSGWARRAGQGAYFDWLTANAVLPEVDPNPDHEGIAKIDRTTVPELVDIANEYQSVQDQLDKADSGLNPVGVANGAIPFDIDPSEVDNNKTHFEQVYERALKALENALTVFDHVNDLTLMLRRVQNQTSSFSSFGSDVGDKERDFTNRLIEIFGYPYSADIGPTGAYPTGYDGPDLYNWMYVDDTDLLVPDQSALPSIDSKVLKILDNKDVGLELDSGESRDVTWYLSSEGIGAVKPIEWGDSRRRAPGRIQMAISDFIQAKIALEKGQITYRNLNADLNDKLQLLDAQHDTNEDVIEVLNSQKNEITGLTAAIRVLQLAEDGVALMSQALTDVASATKEGIPKVAGFIAGVSSGAIIDPGANFRGALEATAAVKKSLISRGIGKAIQTSKLSLIDQKAITKLQTQIDLKLETQDFQISQSVKEIEALVRKASILSTELHRLSEAANKKLGEFRVVLAQGQRLLDELIAFRKAVAAEVQELRYQDMAFRIFRNDALQKYRAQFDLAARYVYLAAVAYDYETNLLGNDSGSGLQFLTDIIRQRSLGQVVGGEPVAGVAGLADPLARLKQNFEVYKTQLGFNNPQTETNRFSLRSELFRIGADNDSDDNWRDVLEQHRVANLWDLTEFRRYCRPFTIEEEGEQPGIVLRFSTTVTFGMNFFGWPLGGGDSAYDPTNFATKARSVGLWFGNYDDSGLSNTPRVYLVPIGADILRSPTDDTLETREWYVVDQRLPVPFPIGASDLNDPEWIPANDSLSGVLTEIRRNSSFRAYHDTGVFVESEVVTDSRIIGRSVWNTDWMIIIPGGTLLADADDGLDTFIHGAEIPGGDGERDGNGISDIKIFFQTYAYSGN